MNTVKRRLISLLVWIILGGAAAYGVVVQRETSEQRQVDAKDERRIVSFKVPAEVGKVAIDNEQGVVVLENQPEGWRVTAPLNLSTDDNAVPSMLYTVLGLERIQEVGERREDVVTPPTDLSLFGLSSPRGKMTLTGHDGRAETLLVGKRNSFDGSLYVKRADRPSVFLVSGKGEHQLLQGLQAYRAKKLVEFNGDDVVEISARVGSQRWLAARDADGFTMKEPVAFRASQERLDGIINNLESMRLSEFFDAPGSAPQPELEGPPLVTIQLKLKAGEVIAFDLYAERVGGQDGTVVFVEAAGEKRGPARLYGVDLLAGTDGSAASYRDMEVMIFDRERVGGVVLSIGDQRIEIERQHPDDEVRPVWFLREPEAGPAHSPRLEGILYSLRRLEAQEIISEAPTAEEKATHGITDAAAKLTLLGDAKQEVASLVLGDVVGDEQFLVSDGRLLKVAKDDLNSLSFDLADYRKQ